MSYINVKNLSKDFQRTDDKGKAQVFHALHDVNFEIERGEFVCLLGFSGCGKSTVLNLLAGFLQPSAGKITIDGEEVKKPSPKYITIFQNYGLLPWKNIRKNVELGLSSEKFKDLSKQDKTDIADKYLKLVGLTDLANSMPCQLSGGQQQRVAIARGLAVNPDILFMDEPFGALDAVTRIKLQDDLLRIVKEENKTVVFVTHDIEEAVYLADRIFVMKSNPGHIEEIIPVRIPRPRDRNSPDFNYIRKKIFNKLFSISENQVEYVI